MATILCIDDEPTILELYATLIEAKGYKVLTAPDGRTGIALTRTHRIDVVVLDFNMPDMNGNEVAQVLRTEQPNLPVAILCGNPDETSESLKWFADALLYKGDGPETLLWTIDRLLMDSGTRNASSEQMINEAPIPTKGRRGAA